MAMNVDKRRRVIWIRRSHEENNNIKGVSGRVFVFIFEYFSRVFLIWKIIELMLFLVVFNYFNILMLFFYFNIFLNEILIYTIISNKHKYEVIVVSMLGDYTTNLNHNLSSLIKKNLDSSRFHENKSSKARAVFQPLHIFPFQRRWGAEWVKQLVTENIRYPVNNAWPRKQHRYFFCTFFFNQGSVI